MEQKPTQLDHNRFEQIHEDTEREPVEREPRSSDYFIQQIKETADKLIRDRVSRGDAKLLNTALKEMRYAFKVFAQYRQRRKVSVFGSARLPLEHPACQSAVDFGKRMAEAGYMVITGAANGIMEAGHIGAGQEASIGVNIMLPFEQSANTIIAHDAKLMNMKYFFTRKLLFVKESDAVALFPGGFGTLDEGFEALTLVQTGKSHLFPIVMVDEPGGDYWKHCRWFIEEVLIKRGFISPQDMSLFKVTDSVDEAVAEILNFYRVYHSMRYVGKDLVIRLNHSLPEQLLQRLNDEFTDILSSGRFVQTHALPAEANEPALTHLERLRFHFDKHSLGRLRQLVDVINTEA